MEKDSIAYAQEIVDMIEVSGTLATTFIPWRNSPEGAGIVVTPFTKPGVNNEFENEKDLYEAYALLLVSINTIRMMITIR